MSVAHHKDKIQGNGDCRKHEKDVFLTDNINSKKSTFKIITLISL